MKTAIQELIEQIDFKTEMHVDTKVLLVLANLKSKALNLLEKEKEQIINAYDSGYKACDLDEALEINKTMFSGDRYYSITYNQNK